MSNQDNLRPSSVEGIKRLADRLQSNGNLKRSEALDQAARQAGFQNFMHARRTLGDSAVAVRAPVPPQQSSSSRRDTYRAEQRRGWSQKVNAAAGTANSLSWRGVDDIVEVLRPFMGSGQNHGYFPTGGGHDFIGVDASISERGCLEFVVSRRLIYLGRPARLRLERIEAETAESFLYIELENIAPSGVYDDIDGDTGRRKDRLDEELVDVGGGHYFEREVWDRGFVEDEGVPLPDNARLVHRLLCGGLMIVCKASVWNGIPQTYNGIHNQLGADEVRRQIELGLSSRAVRRSSEGAT